MRECTVCKLVKNKSEYYFRNKKNKSLHAQCKQCYLTKRRLAWKEYYHKHGSKYRENAVARNRLIKQKLRMKMLKYLNDKSCKNCGISDPRVLEFDHINAKGKSFGIATAIASMISWKNILNEISKCQILCANCHKIKTSSEQGWYKR